MHTALATRSPAEWRFESGGHLYLRELFIKNNGPIRNLHIELTFKDDRPIPHVIVGSNGSGKTNLLSIIADALMQGASDSFTDVLTQSGAGRSYFRVVGGSTVTHGAENGFSVLRFTDGTEDLHFNENSGGITTIEAAKLTPENLRAGLTWTGDQSEKIFTGSEKKKTTIFESGVYAFFPASRSESPHWFNRESISSDSFDVTPHYRNQLGKSLYVERGLDALAQWLLGVITESRLDVLDANYADDGNNEAQVSVTLDTSSYMETQKPLLWANWILQTIMGDEKARFLWTSRWSPRKIAIQSGGQRLTSGLNALSGGQAILLAAFGTILRYADETHRGPGDVEGIVVIDELDAHIHIDLQLSALPELIAFFPKIQFILSSHSPFFTLGMEKKLSPEGVRVLEMPNGMPVIAEAYGEFQKALDALRETKAFSGIIKTAVESGETPIIFVAGETDIKYFRTAARVLGFSHLEELFHWIGEESGAGGGKFTGDSSLDQAVQLLRANPNLTNRKVVAIYDCDARKKDIEFDSVHVIALPKKDDAYCTKGIENLLPQNVFTNDMYEEKDSNSGYGRPNTIVQLKKMALCDKLCGPDADPENFRNFEPALKRLDEVLGFPGESADSDAAFPVTSSS
ncbi:AAA family ATPase [Rhodococcus erythropolis]|uniref:AAA family ATPase n=1 Tax=Rhodococcus erythropolis TaxID=1833 RepID=UPI0037B00C4A